MSYVLGLNQEDNNISKSNSNEKILIFWNVVCKDIQLSLITGKFYNLYQSLNSEATISLLSKLELNKSSVILTMNIVLSKLLQIIVQYIQNNRSNSNKIIYLEEMIKYWFDIYEPYFNFEYDIEKEDISNIIPYSQFEIYFYTLKILFYRHKLTSVLSKNKTDIDDKGLNNMFFPLELNNSNNTDLLLKCCLKYVKKKNRIKKSKYSQHFFNGNKNFLYFDINIH